MASVKSPHIYEFDRLRFLTEAHHFGFTELISVGKRLAQKNPNDFDVKYYLIHCLSFSDQLNDQKQAVSYTQSLIKQKPNLPSLYALLGSVNYSLWFTTNDKTYAAKSIEAYREYLQKAPASFAFRKNAENIIQFIQKREAIQ